MWNIPTTKQLSKVPKLYSTDDISLKEKMIHMHFFIGGCDWFISEYCSKDQIFFGFAILNNDLSNSEWGYVSFQELCEVKAGGFLEVDRDLHFTPTMAKDIRKIREAQGWL